MLLMSSLSKINKKNSYATDASPQPSYHYYRSDSHPIKHPVGGFPIYQVYINFRYRSDSHLWNHNESNEENTYDQIKSHHPSKKDEIRSNRRSKMRFYLLDSSLPHFKRDDKVIQGGDAGANDLQKIAYINKSQVPQSK